MSKCNFKLNHKLKLKDLHEQLKRIEEQSTYSEVLFSICNLCESWNSGHLCRSCLIGDIERIVEIKEGFRLFEAMLTMPKAEFQRRIQILKEEAMKWELKQLEAQGHRTVVIHRLIPLLKFLDQKWGYSPLKIENIIQEFDKKFLDIFDISEREREQKLMEVATAKGILIEYYNLHDAFYYQLVLHKETVEEKYCEYMNVKDYQERVDTEKIDPPNDSLLYWDFRENEPFEVKWLFEKKKFEFKKWGE